MFKYFMGNIFLPSFYVSFVLWSLAYVCIYVNNKHQRPIWEKRILEKDDVFGTTRTLDYIESYPNRYIDRSPNFDICIWLKQHFCPRRQQVSNHELFLVLNALGQWIFFIHRKAIIWFIVFFSFSFSQHFWRQCVKSNWQNRSTSYRFISFLIIFYFLFITSFNWSGERSIKLIM